MPHKSSGHNHDAQNAFYYVPYFSTPGKIAVLARHRANDIYAALRPEQPIIDEVISFPTLDNSLLPTNTHQFLSEIAHTGDYTTPPAKEAFDRIGRIITLGYKHARELHKTDPYALGRISQGQSLKYISEHIGSGASDFPQIRDHFEAPKDLLAETTNPPIYQDDVLLELFATGVVLFLTNTKNDLVLSTTWMPN